MKVKESLKKYLNEDAKRMTKYVNSGLKLAKIMMVPTKKLMEHLLSVQDIPLDREPGEADRQALNAVFNGFHEESYDYNFDTSWARKSLNLSRKHGKNEAVSSNSDWSTRLALKDLSSAKHEVPVEGSYEDRFIKTQNALEEIERIKSKFIEKNLDFDDCENDFTSYVCDDGETVYDKLGEIAEKYRTGPLAARPQSYYSPGKKSVFKRLEEDFTDVKEELEQNKEKLSDLLCADGSNAYEKVKKIIERQEKGAQVPDHYDPKERTVFWRPFEEEDKLSDEKLKEEMELLATYKNIIDDEKSK